MRRLLLVAAGGLAREVLQVVRASGELRRIRVLDDDQARWGQDVDGEPIVGGLELATEYADHNVLVCAGQGSTRRTLVARLTALGVDPSRYVTAVHPRVRIPPGCRVGRGSILLEGVVMTADVQVGSHVVVMPHATLTHDDVLEDFATVCAGVTLGGGVTVGEAAYLGMSSAVRERLVVGRDSLLGMGAVLLEDLPPGERWAGVPARPLRSRVAGA
jgi:sugar O-acyltransferase (sialic acid O-acetyltransferase NeuD family)